MGRVRACPRSSARNISLPNVAGVVPLIRFHAEGSPGAALRDQAVFAGFPLEAQAEAGAGSSAGAPGAVFHMNVALVANAPSAEKEDFAALLDASMGENSGFAGSIITGRVLRIDGDVAVVDVGLKSEGRVPLREFAPPGGQAEIKAGDTIDVYVARYEDKDGSIVLSRERALRDEAWSRLEKANEAKETVSGLIQSRVKGGFLVDLDGAQGFLPGSQVDTRPMRDVTPLMGTPQPFQIIKMDRARGNIVVSRRAVQEEARAEQRGELIRTLKEGAVVDGVVKNLTDYGAFVDLGGVDGLLHVSDLAWRRVNHPSELLTIGQQLQVQVLRFNTETQRISLGLKQLQADPWTGVLERYPVGAKSTGRVTNITDYGAFVELEPGIEGLVHVSEMSWTRAHMHPGQLVASSQEVEVMVLDVDERKRRISLGIKQAAGNPWENFLEAHPPGSVVSGEIRNITEFGLFIGLPGGLDGLVHISDLSWDRAGEAAVADYRKGDTATAKVLDVDPSRERVSLGIKQLEADPAAEVLDKVRKGDIVTCVVSAVESGGIEVKVDEVLTGFIRRAELARDRVGQRPDRFSVGERVDARVIGMDREARRLVLTIKGKEAEEDRQAIARYGTSDSGASLGDILGAAMRRRSGGDAEG